MSAISEKQDVLSAQQIGAGCAYFAGETEGGVSSALTYTAGVCGAGSIVVGYGALTNAWNPLGWVGGAVSGGLFL